MITPGVLAENGDLGFIEIGIALVYLSSFIHVIL
jgi:hypothetical protein